MAQEVVITCAVTGSHNNFHKHPNFPITPKQIADSCLEARKAGAAVTHIHVRDPKTGMRTGDPALFREVVERIRASGSDVLINLTTGEGGRYDPSDDNPAVGGPGTTIKPPLERVRHVEEMRPDICSLDVGSFNFGDTVFINTTKHLRIMAKAIKDSGVKPEIEVFEPGHITFAKQLIEEGLIESPPMFQLCLGIPWAAPATPETMAFMRSLLPTGAKWAGFGISRWEFPMVAQAVALGGHVRVGLEDNLYLDKGVFATNGQLVERAVRIVRSLGAEVAEPARAAELLDLPPRGQRPARTR
ncbi:MAG: 3-keto-5-aminohexanoate cleavage protein [Alphaproteobacteria bacterium]